MPDFILHEGATVLCLHAGQATPTVTYPRVKVSGRDVVTKPFVHKISGCTLPVLAGGPCVIATWVTSATRLRAGGNLVLLKDSQAICTNPGTGVNIVWTQERAKAI